MRCGPRKAISFLILCVIIFTFIGPILSSLADTGVFQSLYLDIISNCPFGDKAAEIAVKILTDSVSVRGDLTDYITGVEHRRTAIACVLEFCKMCLCGSVFTVLTKAGDKVMEIGEKPKGWMLVLKVLWYLVATILCVVVVNSILSYAFEQIQQISNIFGKIMTVIVTLIAVCGSAGMIGVLAGTSIFVTILYGVVKVLLYNGIQLFVTEVAISGLLIAASEGLNGQIFMIATIFVLFLTLMAGIESVISSVMDL